MVGALLLSVKAEDAQEHTLEDESSRRLEAAGKAVVCGGGCAL